MASSLQPLGNQFITPYNIFHPYNSTNMSLLENKTILVTGATGFLGKVFVEKILRIQPNVKKLYLLVRAPDLCSATKRFQEEVLEKEVFKILKKRWAENFKSIISEKVVVVPGDVSCDDFGMENFHLKEQILKETDLIFSCAANTNFDERYDVALDTNTLGALNVLNFSNKCAQIKLMVHVSTAYVYGEEKGILMEQPLSSINADKIDVDLEKKLVQMRLQQLHSENTPHDKISSVMQDFGLERARSYGWPNTYTFTKAMGEKVIVDTKGEVPVVIIRPTMITSTLNEPFPGWMEGVKTLDGVIVSYAKGRLKCLVHDPQVILDLIPADMVVNAIVITMAMALEDRPLDLIYHLGSSLRNPIRLSDVERFNLAFFTRNPWRNRHGKLVKVGKLKTFDSMPAFRIYTAIHYQLPLKMLGLLNATCCHIWEATYTDSKRKLKSVLRIVELYEPYLFFEGTFDIINLEKLSVSWAKMWEKNEEKEWSLGMDIRRIDWEDYMMNVHIPAVQCEMRSRERKFRG